MNQGHQSGKPQAARCALSGLLVCAMLMLSLPARADIIGTERMLDQSAQVAAYGTVENFMQRDQVKAQLLAWGVAPATVQDRVAALSDDELQQLASTIEAQPAGGLLGLIGAVFVVLLILELVGVINVFRSV